MAKSIQSNELGVDNLKRVIAFLIMLGFELADLIRDFSLSKAVSLGFKIAENQDIIAAGRIALQELRDLSPAESQEIVDFVGVNFDLANDTLEERIESGLQLLPEGYALIKTNIAFYQKASAFVKSWGEVSEAKVIELNEKLRDVTPDWGRKLLAA